MAIQNTDHRSPDKTNKCDIIFYSIRKDFFTPSLKIVIKIILISLDSIQKTDTVYKSKSKS